jgi:arsenate reductase (thioredoxin)
MKKRVLVLCTGNSARSQMAEAIINTRRGAVWEAMSAGTQPAPQVNPFALRALSEIGIDTPALTPKPISTFIGQPFDLVITVCDDAAENCPVWLGQGKRIHVGFPDPATVEGTDSAKLSAFRQVRDDIERRMLAALDTFDATL